MKRSGWLLLFVMWLAPAAAQDLEVDLQRVIQREMSEGDLKTAMSEYRKLAEQAARPDGNRAVAAKALLRLADCYLKLGSAEARAYYQRIAREYPDQKDTANAAMKKLAALETDAVPDTVAQRKVLSGKELSELGAAVSRDGRILLYAPDGMDAPSVRNLATGQVTHLGKSAPNVNVYDCRLSEDGSQLAYSWVSGTEWQLRIISVQAGAVPRILLRTTSDVLHYKPHAWSPDGKWLMVELRRADFTWQFARVTVRDAQVTILESTEWRRSLGPGRMRTSLSPDGRFFVYAALAVNPKKALIQPSDPQDTHIFLLGTDGSSRAVLTQSIGFNEDPMWSADGSHVLFLSDRARTFDLWGVAVTDGKASGSPFIVKRNIGSLYNTIPIGTTTAGLYYYTLFPGSLNQISTADISIRNDAMSIGTVRALDGAMGTMGTRPQWSPDGTHLAFVGANEEIFVRTVSSGAERRFAMDAGRTTRPGVALWFHKSDALLIAADYRPAPGGHNRALWKLDLKSGEFTELASVGRFAGRGAFVGALSPDDKTVYVRGEIVRDPPVPPGELTGAVRLDRITALDLDTGAKRVVFEGSLSGLALSPDGGTLAIQQRQPQEQFSIVTVSVDGTGRRELSGPHPFRNALFHPAWTPDSRSIIFGSSDGRDTTLFRISQDGGKPAPIAIPVKGRLSAPTVSPDGKTLAMLIGTGGEVELWAIDVTTALKQRR